MNIRQEVETRITAFAASESLPIAYEGVPFTKPVNAPFLEVLFLSNTAINATVDATRQRVYGTFQVNVAVPEGRGMKQLEALTSAIVALFPVAGKSLFQTFSVEQPPIVSPAMSDGNFRVAAVRVRYRQEL
jgi:hypothetical protein